MQGIADLSFLDKLEEERKRRQQENAGLFNRVTARDLASMAPPPMGPVTTPNVPDVQDPAIQDIATPPQDIAPPPPEREKTWRDTRMGRILLGDRPIEPQGGTSQAQYEDYLKQRPPRPGLAQLAAGIFGSAAANHGRRRGQPLDLSLGEQILDGDYSDQGARLKEASQQEMAGNRIDAIQQTADARVQDIERRSNEALAKLAQQKGRDDEMNQRRLTEASERTLRDLAQRGFNPQLIDAKDIPNYDTGQYVVRELPDGSVIAHSRNSQVQQENAAPKANMQQLAMLAAMERLDKANQSRERIAAGRNATILQRGGAADAAAEKRAELMAKARNGDQAAQFELMTMAINGAADAATQAPPSAVPDPRKSQTPIGKVVRLKNGTLAKYMGDDAQGQPIFEEVKTPQLTKVPPR